MQSTFLSILPCEPLDRSLIAKTIHGFGERKKMKRFEAGAYIIYKEKELRLS